ncbi:energy transducer TonB [Metallibacterium sp.]|uniref:energy transducer TonB n=1 Tax=Metallibacterium sp. TaxID=2940281 RepID=UPI00261F0B96|nr:energy transducer TonB [Metallibacterium sp.]
MTRLHSPARRAHGALIGVALALLPALVLAQSVQRVIPENIDHYWVVDSSHVEVTLPYTGTNINKPGCVAVSFLIGSNGKTLDVRAARVAPPSDLGPSAVSMIESMHYRPAAANTAQQPIASYLIVPFNLPQVHANTPPALRARIAAQRKRYLEPCVLPGYAPR